MKSMDSLKQSTAWKTCRSAALTSGIFYLLENGRLSDRQFKQFEIIRSEFVMLDLRSRGYRFLRQFLQCKRRDLD